MRVRALCVTDGGDLPTRAMFAGLTRAGVALDVTCPGGTPENAALREAGVSVIDLAIDRRLDPRAIGALRRLMKAGRYHIIHVFNNKALTNGLIASFGLPVRIVAYRGIVGNVSFFDPVSWTRFLNPRIDRIVCVADAVRDFFVSMRPAFLRRPDEVFVRIYKGHDVSWYSEPPVDLAQFGIPEHAFVVVCVTNYRPRKGIEDLVDAMRALAGDESVHLLLIGSMDRPKLRRRIAASPCAPRIHVAGYRKDASALVASCDVFVLPARRREGLPRSVIESMCRGTPAIVTDAGGSPELVVDGVSGLVVPPSDPPAIAAAVRRLHRDAELRESMGRAARERIATSFRIDDTITQTLRLYEELAGR